MMSQPSGCLPTELLSSLLPVESSLLVHRYVEALWAITKRKTGLSAFHIDAAGYSPEVAQELEDPFYLGQGIDHPFFIVLSVDQLGGPVIQPNMGLAAYPYRSFTFEHRKEIASLTLTEPLFGEMGHGTSRFFDPSQLQQVCRVDLEVRTPSDRLGLSMELSGKREALLESDHLWYDEDFVERMLDLARRVEGLFPPPFRLMSRTLPVGPSFVPNWGGCYVYPIDPDEEGGQRILLTSRTNERSAVKPSVRSSHRDNLLEVPLTVESVVEFLEGHGFVEVEKPFEQLSVNRLQELMGWVSLDHLIRIQWDLESHIGPCPDLADAVRMMRMERTPPAVFAELDAALWKVRYPSAGLNWSSLSALTRLRLSTPIPGDDRKAAFVRHLQAFLDPIDLSRAHDDAKDLLYARYASLDEWKKRFFLAWLKRRESTVRGSSSATL